MKRDSAIQSLIDRRAECAAEIAKLRDEIHSLNKGLYAFGVAKLKQNVTAARWDEVDWAENDRDLAGKLGCSRERVRQKRRAMGMPDPDTKRKTPNRIALERWIEANQHLQGKVTLPQVVEAMGEHAMSTAGTISVLKKHGFALRGLKKYYFHDLCDWGLPNKLIAELWCVDCQAVASQRYIRKAGPAKWAWRTQPQQDPELAAAIQAERKKIIAFAEGKV